MELPTLSWYAEAASVVLTSALLRLPLVLLHLLLLRFRGGPCVIWWYQEGILNVLHPAAGPRHCGIALSIGCLYPLKPGARLRLRHRTLAALRARRRCGELFRWLQFFKLGEGYQDSDSRYNWNRYLHSFHRCSQDNIGIE